MSERAEDVAGEPGVEVTVVAGGLAGLTHTSRLSTADPNAAIGIELAAIAACVIGGTSLFRTHEVRQLHAVLQCLAEARGHVVSRNDILDEVWPGAAVTDDVLTQCIVELRKAFDDSAGDGRLQFTVTQCGLGFIFLAL